jgi:uncharacterized OB-fold protein
VSPEPGGVGSKAAAIEWSKRPRPRPTGLTEPFWDALRAGRLAVQRCLTCGAWRWPPQPACPSCLSEEYRWAPTAGLGRLYSFTVVHRPVDPAMFDPPYVLGIVELDEGPRLLTNIVDCRFDELRVDLRVGLRVVVRDDGINLYPFAPDPSRDG